MKSIDFISAWKYPDQTKLLEKKRIAAAWRRGFSYLWTNLFFDTLWPPEHLISSEWAPRISPFIRQIISLGSLGPLQIYGLDLPCVHFSQSRWEYLLLKQNQMSVRFDAMLSSKSVKLTKSWFLPMCFLCLVPGLRECARTYRCAVTCGIQLIRDSGELLNKLGERPQYVPAHGMRYRFWSSCPVSQYFPELAHFSLHKDLNRFHTRKNSQNHNCRKWIYRIFFLVL